ncbi:hypothetical protein AU210_013081 [Fusarium oxysporum f. sp. radicis-cucumerinum]|uniref:Uncharacterized protein n=1 Tax=Fusarium oxysporum f. sp. radicis-cucumerinum TaxID=327505 RepID=A0A2H3GP81_FUSOX|nr:hypothetical protein AU210_013081 [Fusarium oxysporum f. sp. radicis-cucumerinum]RKK37906.1 hypothetical protein BFJ66_g12725 [Fusarium oxysporum f. sp. cepae]
MCGIVPFVKGLYEDLMEAIDDLFPNPASSASVHCNSPPGRRNSSPSDGETGGQSCIRKNAFTAERRPYAMILRERMERV